MYHLTSLDKNKIIEFKTILEGKKKELEVNRKERMNVINENDDCLKDSVDIANFEKDSERMWIMAKRERISEARVSSALQRIENGSYGNCLDCDSPISYKRLLFDPTSELCVSCKNEMEADKGYRSTN